MCGGTEERSWVLGRGGLAGSYPGSRGDLEGSRGSEGSRIPHIWVSPGVLGSQRAHNGVPLWRGYGVYGI